MDKRFTKLDGVCKTLSADLTMHAMVAHSKTPRLRFTDDAAALLPDVVDVGYHYDNGRVTVAVCAGTSLRVNRPPNARDFLQAARLIRAIERNHHCTLEIGEWVPCDWDGDTLTFELRTTEAPAPTMSVEVTR